MTELSTVKIQDPDVEGSHIVINETDFNPEVHKRFEEPEKAPEKAAATKKAEAKDDPFPDGYHYESKGAYGHLYGPDEIVIEGPANGKFQGRKAALEAALAHAAAHPREDAAAE